MFILDQLRRNDQQLQVVSLGIVLGMVVLLSGLWYVQIVSSKRYEQSLQRQTFRSVRIPATRGRILDRNGQPLAENRAAYDVDAYLEEVLAPFEQTNTIFKDYKKSHSSVKLAEVNKLKQEARFQIVSNLATRIATTLHAQMALTSEDFFSHLSQLTYVSFPIVKSLKSASPNQLAIYSEQLANEPCIDLDIHPMRYYPNNNAAVHIIGYVRSSTEADEDEEISFQYRQPYWRGKAGVESACDPLLCGTPGVKQIVVNNYSYRQKEETTPADPGEDIYLTIDLEIQKAADAALAGAMHNTHGAVVVLDVHNGDILAMCSSPSYNPNAWTGKISPAEFARFYNDPVQKPMFNRATGAYLPGSIFKIITSIACLESGLNTSEIYSSLGYYPLTANTAPTAPKIKDTAPPGDYDFEKAFYKSSNSYFCYHGAKLSIRKYLEVGRRFHLGELTELGLGTESIGYFPAPDNARGWDKTELAYASIGQKVTTSPLQMAGMIATIANGGTLYWPRIISHKKSPVTGAVEQINKQGRVRDNVQINPRHLEIIRHAMVLDTEHTGATAYNAFNAPPSTILTGAKFRVASKTGTAQRREAGINDHVTWFASFGPYESPRYAVIVMVEGGISGGTTCAPVARKIYEAIVKLEQKNAQKSLAQN